MSFPNAASCSTASNPLSQFTKQFHDDHSLQRDRLGPAPAGQAQDSFRSAQPVGHHDHMMNEFAQQRLGGAASPFAMVQMSNELPVLARRQDATFAGQNGWAAEFGPEQQQSRAALARPDFGSAKAQMFQQAGGEELLVSRHSPALSTMQNTSLGARGAYFSRPMGMGMMGGGMYAMQQRQQQDTGKGKGRMVELDDKNWEEQFAQIDAGPTMAGANTDSKAEEDIERELNDVDRSVSETNHDGDFEAIWRGIKAEEAERSSSKLADDFDSLKEQDWEELLRQAPPLRTYDQTDLPNEIENYLFEEENFFNDPANVADPFAEGVRILDEGGNLSLAALAFEAAVQRDPTHVAAWTLLGSAQAQNEKETPAIRALEMAIRINPSDLDALMGLAVSYTNESYDSSAYRTLERWLSTKYPELHPAGNVSPSGDLDYMNRAQLHEKLTQLFIRAAQLSPAGEQMDPDVQVGLGVLFYGAEEYDKAVDCFSAALASTEAGTSNQRQQVHLLWNRLGATLANSSRPEEAVVAYEKALTLRPNFVRARYNLGVSCINIGCYVEAAQHLLGALAMHDEVVREGRQRAREVVGGQVPEAELEVLLRQNQSTNLYDTLKRVFILMDRKELADQVGPGLEVNSFRGEFDF
ncbi:MAG: Peroxisomal membrane signal receptor PTS1 [Vezdaea aestivalis]|nr:MAG: Peroxisomal membrane signal receptor PTS1 [Vezdaea aestivalis]